MVSKGLIADRGKRKTADVATKVVEAILRLTSARSSETISLRWDMWINRMSSTKIAIADTTFGRVPASQPASIGIAPPERSAADAHALTDLSPRSRERQVRSIGARWRRPMIRLLAPLVLLSIWQLITAAGWVQSETLPSPAAVWAAFQELTSTGDLQRAIPVSLARACTGLAVGGGIGLVLGLFAGLWRVGEEIFDAPLQMLRTIPFIALIPLFIVWFGIDETPKIALITGASIVPVYLNTYAGVRGVDPKLIEAGRIFGLTHRQVAIRIIVPTALPSILVGFRYAAGVSLLALVAAEQINAQSGIGYILMTANMNQRPDVVIVGVIVYAILGITTDLVTRLIESAALPWKPKLALA
jgi:sulfonate transport system permease protein